MPQFKIFEGLTMHWPNHLRVDQIGKNLIYHQYLGQNTSIFFIFYFGNFTYLTFCHPILFPRPLKHNISMTFHRNFWKFSSLIKINTKKLSYRFLIIGWLVHNQFMGLTNPLKVVVHYFLIGGTILTIKMMFP